MRGRFLFTAALIAAAYVKGRVDATPLAEDWLPPARDPVNDVTRAMAETAATTVTGPAPARAPAAEDDTASLLAELAAPAEADRSPGSRSWVIPVQVPPTPPETVSGPEEAHAGGDAEPAFDEIHAGWAAAVAAPDEDVAGGEVCGTAADVEGVLVDVPSAPEDREGSPGVPGTAPPADADLAERWTGAWVEGEESGDPVEEPPDTAPIAAVGPFAISGVATGAGDLAFGRVMFPARLGDAPSADDVTLTVEHATNVPDAGVSVMRDAGFGPSPEGLTLVVAVQEPGRFVVRGHYTVRRPGAGASA